MALGVHHDRMDPIAFLIANDVSRRALEGAQPPSRRTARRLAGRSPRVRT
jgi:hypothetical protein